MLFFSMLNSENKTYDLKKVLPIMLCRFSNELFALKKYRILHIEYLTRYLKNSGIKLLTNIVLNRYLLLAFLKNKIKMVSVM